MASYLRSWLSPSSSLPLAQAQSDDTDPPPSNPATPTASRPYLSHDEEENDDTDTESDTPPAFPALSSAQRIQPPSPAPPTLAVPRLFTTGPGSMPPPPPPRLAVPGGASGGLGVPVPAAGSSLMPPPTTTRIPTLPAKKREKVALTPGHSPLDWAMLKQSGADLRGGAEQIMRIPPSVLKRHNKRDDAWSAFNGKVYNITPYLAFHPGGEQELMRVAGRDGTKLFASTHAWVNADFMLDACLVGFLVKEPTNPDS